MRKKITAQQLQTAFSTRQYMLSKDFELYYYSDTKMKKVAAHAHDYYEFYFFLEGDVSMNIAGSLHKINPGDFLLIPPHTTHFPILADTATSYRRFVLWISTDYCNRLLEAAKEYVYLMQYVKTSNEYLFSTEPIIFNAIQSMIFQLIDEIKSKRFGREAQLSLSLNELLLFLNRTIYERTHVTNVSDTSIHQALCRYIDGHLSDDLSLDTLEQEFFVSKYYISHTFKDNMGISLHQYITKKRLHACKDAIVSNEPVTAVYERFGFHDYSNFYRSFKKEFGFSPLEYQKLYTL